MKNKNFSVCKRLLSVFLSVLMMVSCLPVLPFTAFAEEGITGNAAQMTDASSVFSYVDYIDGYQITYADEIVWFDSIQQTGVINDTTYVKFVSARDMTRLYRWCQWDESVNWYTYKWFEVDGYDVESVWVTTSSIYPYNNEDINPAGDGFTSDEAIAYDDADYPWHCGETKVQYGYRYGTYVLIEEGDNHPGHCLPTKPSNKDYWVVPEAGNDLLFYYNVFTKIFTLYFTEEYEEFSGMVCFTYDISKNGFFNGEVTLGDEFVAYFEEDEEGMTDEEIAEALEEYKALFLTYVREPVQGEVLTTAKSGDTYWLIREPLFDPVNFDVCYTEWDHQPLAITYDASQKLFYVYAYFFEDALLYKGDMLLFTYAIGDGDLADGTATINGNFLPADSLAISEDDCKSAALRLIQEPVTEPFGTVLTNEISHETYWLPISLKDTTFSTPSGSYELEVRYDSCSSCIYFYCRRMAHEFDDFNGYTWSDCVTIYNPRTDEITFRENNHVTGADGKTADIITSNVVYFLINPPVPDVTPSKLYLSSENCSCTDYIIHDSYEYCSVLEDAKLYATENAPYILLEHSDDSDTFIFGMTIGSKKYDYYAEMFGLSVTPLGHDFNAGITENVTVIENASCIKQGKIQIKCSRCDAVTEQLTDYASHQNLTTINYKTATCKEDGYTGDSFCFDCNKIAKEGNVIHKEDVAHIYTEATITNATCTQDGTIAYRCSVCNNSYTETIPAKGHIDEDGNGICDVCLFEIYAPQCSHMCHSTNPLLKAFWKIINFFNKLFGTNQICSCGAKHW